MKVYKHCGTFVLLTVCTFFVQIHAIDLCGDSWFNYKDDKCYKIYNDMLYTFEDAKGFCSRIYENDLSSLATIGSKEEQEFLMNYVFKIEKKVDNFWIGAKYDNGTFHWVDNSTLGYTNWLKATKNKTDTCVQVQAEEDWAGKWLDVPCTVKSSLVVCQKVQWTRARLEKADDEAQHRLQVSTAEANKEIHLQNEIISEAKKAIEEAKQTIVQQEHKIQEANEKLIRPTKEINQADDEFRKLSYRIAVSAKVLKYPTFPDCGWRIFVEANFNDTCYQYSCHLYRDQPYKFEIKFVANQDSQKVHVRSWFDGDKDKIKNGMNEDGCKYVKCPLVKGQEYSFIVDNYRVNFANIYDVFSGDFRFLLWGDNGGLACHSMKYYVSDNTVYRTTPPTDSSTSR